MSITHLVAVSMSLSSAVSGADVTRDALIKTADRRFHLVLVGAGIVAIGCILEIGEASVEWLHWWWRKKDKPFFDDETRWTVPLSIAGVILVIAGVAGEGYFEAKQATAETAIRQYDEQKLTQAETDAASANGRAANVEKENLTLKGSVSGLQTSTTNVQTELAKQQLRAAMAEAETLRLQEAIQPRRYTPQQEDAIVAACKPYSGSPVTIRTLPYDVEGAIFGMYLADLLKRAGLTVNTSGVGNNFMQNLPMFMDVGIAGPSNQFHLEQALLAVLSTPRVPTTAAGIKVPTLTIFVGAKKIISANAK